MTSSEAYCSLNEGTIDFIDYLCMWGLANITIESSVSSSNVTNSEADYVYGLPEILGRLLFTYLCPPLGADKVSR
jgi:hypothetical protein